MWVRQTGHKYRYEALGFLQEGFDMLEKMEEEDEP